MKKKKKKKKKKTQKKKKTNITDPHFDHKLPELNLMDVTFSLRGQR